MNKFIAAIFGELLSLVHIIFILLMFFLATEKNSKILNYIPDVFLTTGNRTGLVILLSVIYVAVMGSICIFVSINTYLREIRDILANKTR